MSPRYSETDRQHAMNEVRNGLMQAAMHEIAQKGYDQANVNTISLAAGFAKGTIYNYFSSKQDLMFAILQKASLDHFDFMAEKIRQVTAPIDRVHHFFEAGFQFVEENPARAQVLISTLYGTHSEFKERLYQLYQPMFQLVAAEVLAPGVAQGVFKQIDPVSTSVMVMTFYLGTASSVDAAGKPWMDPGQVAAFTLGALLKNP